HFLMQVALREGKDAKKFDAVAVELMKKYPWPGNVRELQNICERASVLTRGPVIAGAMIEPWLSAPAWVTASDDRSRLPHHSPAAHGSHHLPPLPTLPGAVPGTIPGADGTSGLSVQRLEEVERQQVLAALGRFNGNRQKTAEALGIGLRTLGLKLKKWKQLNLVEQTV
ncbi:MAG: hypothetical protein IT442_10890, partial [Phycisphaeraceae bacterium]|nr:hypothetical protein [Phycisphaeraceae bacterium]